MLVVWPIERHLDLFRVRTVGVDVVRWPDATKLTIWTLASVLRNLDLIFLSFRFRLRT
jgi:hypothetical protein